MSLEINFTPFNKRFNKHPTSRVYRSPFRRKCTLRRHPSASRLRGVLLASETFFCGNFYGARLRANRGEIKDSPWKVDHEHVTIHFPLGNYVIK